VRYVVNGTGPGGTEQLVSEAVAAISAATGLQFVDAGTTAETPTDDRASYQPDRYGRRWAPLLISWSSPAESPGLAGHTIGLGGPVIVQDATGYGTYVTGTVWLDAPQFAADLTDEPSSALPKLRGVVMHELGHAMGLEHVSDPGQIMYPDVQPQTTTLGEGDRRGLAALGRGRCAPQL
jgi:hypothetical protein